MDRNGWQDWVGIRITRELRESKKSPCSRCGAPLSARVATFSFSKALGYFQFQAVWDASLRTLREAKTWLFIGYSLPEADFQIRHLLKTAQMGRKKPPRIFVALLSPTNAGPPDRTRENYERFFGKQSVEHIEAPTGQELLEQVIEALEALG